MNTGTVLDTDEFYLASGEYIEGLGYHIDETSVLGESILFCGHNDIALHKGSYCVTINYIADGDGNSCYFESPDDAFNSLRYDLFNLHPDLTSISGIIRINDNRDDYKFCVTYCGAGTLVIQSILIEQTNDYLLGICTFLCFGALLPLLFV